MTEKVFFLSSEFRDNYVRQRINSVEKNLSEVFNQLSNYTAKLAHVRDAGDDVVQSVINYATKENLNQTLKAALLRFSDIFSGVQDYRETEIHRLEVKVVNELSSYGQICRHAREEVRHHMEARAKELSKKHHLEKLKRKNPTNPKQIAEAESEFHRATAEANKSNRITEKEIDDFEKNKLEDIKRVFLEFIKIEMLFHSKALELYTKAYNSIIGIKVEEDLEAFRNCLRSPSETSRLEMVRHTLSPEDFQGNALPSQSHKKSHMRSEPRSLHLQHSMPSSSSSRRKSFSESE